MEDVADYMDGYTESIDELSLADAVAETHGGCSVCGGNSLERGGHERRA